MSSNTMTTHFFPLQESQTWFNKYDRSTQKLRVEASPQPYICFKNQSGMLTVILLDSGQVLQYSFIEPASTEVPFRLSQNFVFTLKT